MSKLSIGDEINLEYRGQKIKTIIVEIDGEDKKDNDVKFKKWQFIDDEYRRARTSKEIDNSLNRIDKLINKFAKEKYGTYNGYYVIELTRYWLENTNDEFFEKYGFNYVPPKELVSLIKCHIFEIYKLKQVAMQHALITQPYFKRELYHGYMNNLGDSHLTQAIQNDINSIGRSIMDGIQAGMSVSVNTKLDASRISDMVNKAQKDIQRKRR